MPGKTGFALLCCTLVLLQTLQQLPSIQAKRRPAHSHHHSTEAAAAREQKAFELPGGGYVEEDGEEEEEEFSAIVPLEAAEQHFSLMPDRPAVEEEDAEVAVAPPLSQLGEGGAPAKGAYGVFGHHKAAKAAALPHCTPEGMGQVPNITGTWVDHPSTEHIGLYDPRTDCPEYAEDFNCLRPYPPAQPNQELAAREFRKVFQADQCALRPWDAPSFEKCLAGRRLFLIGDSLMRQQFASLACLLKPVSRSGKSARWDLSDIKYQGDYIQPWGAGQTPTSKQFVGEFELNNGARVIIRSFGTYNSKLWDDVFSDFAPITANDVILVNFGAWYPRFKITEPGIPWEQWKADMTDMFQNKLVNTSAQVIWKDYSPSHFSGGTGTFNGIDESLKEVPSRVKCEPASVGEFWYQDWINNFLTTTCGEACSRIRVLPIFDLSLPRYDSHHGSFGRGRFDDKATDCRHFCNNVVDTWSTMFYNMLCA